MGVLCKISDILMDVLPKISGIFIDKNEEYPFAYSRPDFTEKLA